jgi:PAS domain S-box-containing protein
MKVLVVDEDPQSLRRTQSLLEGQGITVLGAGNGAQAMDQLRRESFELILSEVLLSKPDGFQLCRAVKADPTLRHISFLFYTAESDSAEDEALALRLGCDAFLIKPMEPNDLLAAVRAALARPGEEAAQTPSVPRGSENLFQLLAQSAPIGIFFVSPAGEFAFVNDRWCAIAGVDREAASLSTWQRAIHPEDRQRVSEEWQRAVARRAVFQSEFRFRQADGNVAWVQAQAHPSVKSAGPGVAYVGTITDVTVQRSLEQERAEIQARLHQAHKLETIGTLVSGISHDFNNLVGAIFGYAEMARRQLAQVERAGEDLQLLLSAAERAKALTGQILRFSRKQKEELRPIQIGPVVKEALALLRASLPRNVRCTEAVAEVLPQVLAEGSQIHQVVMNLVTNAMYALREKGGEVKVTVEALEVHPALVTLVPELEEGDYVVLSVHDTGRGIPPELLSRIFDPFFTTKPTGEGTGMGLAVVHDIVKGHGGAITVTSQPGQGSTFTVYLPAMSKAGQAPAPEGERLPQHQGPRVIYVDNEQLLASMVKRMLEMLGYRATVFTDSAEALQHIRARPEECDLVMSDMDMPGMSGAALARRLLETRPGLPILFVSGVNKSITREAALHLGARDVLLKPFDLRALGEAVANALSGNVSHPA